ncbi:hypothetical protein BXZ70DRAFT_908208 [Cristinia sonorae]|uniref:Uncharacterized protein n=1 Tax=Cristinia sonorae TaxID=1940300 RepID=A0A8K0ULS4_9AGAR|nr:hypothetical protein BXZ70DRAFT_908208 [Cristinia sonorae]
MSGAILPSMDGQTSKLQRAAETLTKTQTITLDGAGTYHGLNDEPGFKNLVLLVVVERDETRESQQRAGECPDLICVHIARRVTNCRAGSVIHGPGLEESDNTHWGNEAQAEATN